MLNFYDFEVLKYNWMIQIINPVDKTETLIVNDRKKLEEYYEVHKNEIWVGYNSRGYDQYILKAILLGFDPKELNDFIIKKGMKGWQFSNLFNCIKFNNYDVFKIATDRGLKMHEGFMGQDIQESQIPFDIDDGDTDTENEVPLYINGRLTEAGIEHMAKYCKHDVEQTIEVWLERKADFDAVFGIIKMFDLPLEYIGKTETQLAAIVLGARKPPQERDDEFEIEFPPYIELGKYDYVRQWYLNPENHDYKKELKTEIAGVPHTFAWGGIHGARKRFSGEGIFINMDVASYYPAAQIEYDWLSRNVPPEGKEKYRKMRDDRLVFKAEKDPRAYPLKITLNKAFGGCKDKYSALFDPKRANDICVGGQLLLLDLMEKIEHLVDVIQSNTDGVLVRLRHEDDFAELDDIAYEWEQRNHLTLEFDEFSRVYQKDVNNYIGVTPEGKIKGKGAYVKDSGNLDYDLVVVKNAMIDFMVHGTPVEETVYRTEAIRDFQKMVKISAKYEYGVHNGQRLNDTVFRVFASKDENDSTIAKKKASKERPEKFANTPDHCFIDNGYILGKTTAEYPKLDHDWYIELAKKRLEQFGVLQ